LDGRFADIEIVMKLPMHARAMAGLFALWAASGVASGAGEAPGAAQFRHDVRPVLETFCFDCHGDGAKKGGVAFDELKTDEALLDNRDLWWKALKNLRAGIMPPARKPRPSPEQREQIAQWIKSSVFQIDPRNPDPGRVTIRRLNRVEYRNTIHDLLGVDFDTDVEFPPDDTGYGFDDIGDVLTLPPMLLEKYMAAAAKIVAEAVPTEPKVVPEHVISGQSFQPAGEAGDAGHGHGYGPRSLSYYTPATVSGTFSAAASGKYQLLVDLRANEKYVDNVFDYNKCRVVFTADGHELMSHDYGWEGGKSHHYEFDQAFDAGDHKLAFALQTLTPNEKQTRTLSMQITSVTVRGPLNRENWVRPGNYDRFFPKPIPADAPGRRAYARELLGTFARRAYRRPVDGKTVDRLTALAEEAWSQPGKTFEAGVAHGMVAVLASPRFLFLEEEAGPAAAGPKGFAPVDEYSLASRLSYFLWSSMPDEELTRMAAAGQLRANLSAQLARMLKDHRSEALIKDFAGQWLRTRDIAGVPIEERAVLDRETAPDPDRERIRKRYHELADKPEKDRTPQETDELATIREARLKYFKRPLRAELNYELRSAMRSETEDVFGYVLREDRSLLELLDSDYTFLNQRLARLYGITNVMGGDMRLVHLPPDSPRGGVITEGTVLVVTSNPTRTSPVKRGVFILDSILGTPAPPPPPNIPPLEDAAKGLTNHMPTLRDTLAAHRQNPMCASCHNRLDPLGLALENFNAMGMWRDAELNQPIDASARLITGEEFANVKELKRILVKNHAEDFYRALAEKMLTYALGRGLEYYDVETVDQIVARIETAGGRPSALLAGIVESAPFQKCRTRAIGTAGLGPRQTAAELSGTP
jgi:mono/diheme cytochrome c family protein